MKVSESGWLLVPMPSLGMAAVAGFSRESTYGEIDLIRLAVCVCHFVKLCG
jgi:hypothetical protein